MLSLRSLFTAFCIFVLVSCQLIASPPIDKSTIIGQWVEKDITLKVCKDGRFISTDGLTGEQFASRFELIEGNIIRVTHDRSGPVDYKASVHQGILTVTCVNNNATARLTRCNNSSLCPGQKMSYCN